MRELIRKILREQDTSKKGGYPKKTKEQFVADARKVHGDRFNYDLVNYQDNKTPVEIVCPDHGKFLQAPSNHLSGKGCRKCADEENRKNYRLSQDEFIKRARDIHKDEFGKPLYDYSKVDFSSPKHLNQFSDVTIICPTHGPFEKSVVNHLAGQGCKHCAREKLSKEKLMTKDYFLEKAKNVHGDKFDYSLVDFSKDNYQGALKTKLPIICPKHGVFYQNAASHLKGNGCPRCNESKGERMTTEVLMKMGIKFEKNYYFEDCLSNKCRKLFFDFYLPELKILIEYDGEQHFEPVTGRDKEFLDTLERDKIKNDYAKKNKIKLIRIPYTFNTPELIEKDLKKFLKKK